MSKEVAVLTIGRVAQIVLSLVSVRVFTSVLAPSEIGKYYFIFTLISFFSQALINPVGMYINRCLHKWVQDRTILNSIFLFYIYLILLSIIALVAVTILHKFLGVGISLDLVYLNISVVLILIFLTMNQTIIGSLNMLNYRVGFVVFTILTQVITLALSILFVNLFEATVFAWISGQIVALIIISVASLIYFHKVCGSGLTLTELAPQITFPKISIIVAFTMPLMITSIFIWLQYQSYRLIIEKFVSLEFLGFIGLGFAIASSIFAAVESLIHQLYLPLYYSNINTNDPLQRVLAWNKMAQLTFPLYLSATLLISALAPFLLTVLSSRTFSNAYIYVIFGAWIELFRSATNTLSSVAHSEMQTRSLLKSYLWGAVLAVSATLYCASSRFQSMIPAVLTVSGLVTLVIMYFDMRKLMNIYVNIGYLAKTMLLSLPLVMTVFLFTLRSSLYWSFAICSMFSLYILAIQYRNAKLLVIELGATS